MISMKFEMADVAIPAEIAMAMRNMNGGIVLIITTFYSYLEPAHCFSVINDSNILLRLRKSEIGNSSA